MLSYSAALSEVSWVLCFMLLMEVRGEKGQIIAKEWAKDKVERSMLDISGQFDRYVYTVSLL